MAPASIVCYCNYVDESHVIKAIEDGANTLSKIYDSTEAGSGTCGGSCRTRLKTLLKQHSPLSASETNEVLENADEEIPKELIEAVSLFNRRYYWETHEVLQAVWLMETGKKKIFFQGLIQGAAALYHVLNANAKGCLKLGQDSLEKLKKFPPDYMNLQLQDVVEKLEQFIIQAREILGNTRTGFDYKILPMLTIGKEMELPR